MMEKMKYIYCRSEGKRLIFETRKIMGVLKMLSDHRTNQYLVNVE
jgi:hypothetical protein